MEGLKPCPFCGGKPESEVSIEYLGGSNYLCVEIRCKTCRTDKRELTSIPNSPSPQEAIDLISDTYARAIRKWDTRKGG